jgi:uncharacterized coiled-coil DUF342 family protein
MFKSRLFLSLIAFVVSFFFTLLASRFNLGQAFGAGMLTLISSFVGAAVAAQQQQYQLRQRVEELREHVRVLQRRRMEVYEEWTLIAAERDQIASSLDFLQMQLQQLQTKSTDLWKQKEALSWNLAQPKTAALPLQDQGEQLPVNLHHLQQQEAELTRSVANILAAQQRAEASLKHTETELNQLHAMVAEQQSLKRQLAEEVIGLTAQKQELDRLLGSLQPQVNNLEHYKTELNQFLQSAEPKRQQIETGSKTLHSAIEQLQRQIVSLHSELIHLEGQIGDRRQQKEELDQELATLKQQASPPPTVKPNSSSARRGTAPSQNGSPAAPTTSPVTQKNSRGEESVPQFVTLEAVAVPTAEITPPPVSFVITSPSPSEASAVLPPPSSAESATAPSPSEIPASAPLSPPHPSGLSNDWLDLMTRLPEPELQALRAIAEERNPMAQLKQIAETNLTMPELLVDSINEHALDTIGDMIVESVTGAGAKIIRDHQDEVKKLLEIYQASTVF